MTNFNFTTRSLVPLLLFVTAPALTSCDSDDGAGTPADASTIADSRSAQDTSVIDAVASNDSSPAPTESYTPSQMAFCNSPCMQSVKTAITTCFSAAAGTCTRTASSDVTLACYATRASSRRYDKDGDEYYAVASPNGDLCLSVDKISGSIFVDTSPADDVIPLFFTANDNKTVIVGCGRNDDEADSELFAKAATICGIPFMNLVPSTTACTDGACEAAQSLF